MNQLHCRKVDLAETAALSAGKDTQVVAYLVDFNSYTFQSCGISYKAGCVGSCSYKVFGELDIPSCNLSEGGDAFFGIASSAVMPVPIAVAPMFTVRKSAAALSRCRSSSSRIEAKPLKVCPKVIGTASSH